MDRIFWVVCPECKKSFYCDYGLRNSQYKLMCPFCSEQFFDVDSPEIDERVSR